MQRIEKWGDGALLKANPANLLTPMLSTVALLIVPIFGTRMLFPVTLGNAFLWQKWLK